MILDNDNFVNFAMKHYENPSCKTIDDFNDDLNRFKYLRKLLNRYLENDDTVNFRLILNHIVILYNVFDYKACTSMLFFKTERHHWSILKPILEHMNYLPDFIVELGINTSLIHSDPRTLDELKAL